MNPISLLDARFFQSYVTAWIQLKPDIGFSNGTMFVFNLASDIYVVVPVTVKLYVNVLPLITNYDSSLNEFNTESSIVASE